jgi:nicotinamidase-related amidase
LSISPPIPRFFRSYLYDVLIAKRIGTVVVSGAETDVCVLATVLSAVDLGLRVVIVCAVRRMRATMR